MSKKFFLFVSFSLLLLSCQSQRQLITQDLANRQLANGQLEAALESYETLAKQADTQERKAALWFRAAEVSAALGDFERSLESYLKSMRSVPFSELAERASQRRAELYLQLNNSEAMLAEYAQLIKHYPKSANRYMYRLRLAEAHLILGHFPDALHELENMYPDPDLPAEMKETVFFNAAELYFLDGKFQQAMNVYSAFLQTFPDSVLAGEAHLKLASVLERLGQINMAVQATKPAEKLYPNKEVVEMRLRNLNQNMVRDSSIPPQKPSKKKRK